MTQQGVTMLYEYLAAAWPLVIKPGVDEAWKRGKLKELYRTYDNYRDEEVLEAFQKWTDENDRFPTTKNILNEIRWARTIKAGPKENETLWPMNIIYNDGNEYCYGCFKRVDFINHPRNPEHLDPEEWERRFRVTYSRVMKQLIEARGGKVDYAAAKEWVDFLRGLHDTK